MVAIQIPHLRKTATSKQLIVHGKPFLMRAAELQNSVLSSADYMMAVWPKLVDTHINTVLGSVTWEMIEPKEDQFDFSELDQVILGARKFGLKLVLLWFGSFKNGEPEHLLGSHFQANLCQAYLHTPHHGLRWTRNDFPVPNFGSKEAF
jgi:beta-galactosidase GanA